MASLMAASICISPSASSSGARPWISAKACRKRTALGLLRAPKLECETKAMRGSRPNSLSRYAAASADSAICSALGSYWTWVPEKKNTHLPLSREEEGREGEEGESKGQ